MLLIQVIWNSSRANLWYDALFWGVVFMKPSENDLFILYELFFHIKKKNMAVGAPLIRRCLC